MTAATASGNDRLPRATLLDTVRLVTMVLLPLMGRGLIVRRPPVVAVAERLDLDRRAVRQMQRLRDRYGDGPLVVRLPGRTIALVLHPDHVHRVLQGSPETFSAANLEKRRALGHFQPAGVLISEGSQREERRRLNEAALDTPAAVHCQADAMLRQVREEASELLEHAEGQGELDWDTFIEGWYRLVRRVTFGDDAADDEELTDLLGQLRAYANWSYLRRKRREVREEFLTRLRERLHRAEPGSLAHLLSEQPAGPDGEPHQQIPQWLFAFDPAGIATFRALALIDAHPQWRSEVHDEVDGADLDRPTLLPRLRSTVLESLRLWPTTPGVLRDSKEVTHWERGRLESGAAILVHAPFFHRDDRRIAEADRFAPELWERERTTDDWPLIPFSDGPVVCPGRNVVLLLTSAILGSLLERHELRLRTGGRLDPSASLPSVLDPFTLSFGLAGRRTS